MRVRPKEDELRSSWMARLALANGTDAKTFWLAAWPRKYVWGGDLDKRVDRAFEEMVARKTSLPLSAIKATALQSLRGRLYRRHTAGQQMPWVMPLGMISDRHHRFGLQFCPCCLAEDEEPYFRRRWRLSMTAICVRHQVLLSDRCPRCGEAVNFHLNRWNERQKRVEYAIALCYSCGYDLRSAKRISRHQLLPVEVVRQRVLQNALRHGLVAMRNVPSVTALTYLSILRRMMRMLLRAGRHESFRDAAAAYFCATPLALGQGGGEKAFETMGAESRLNLLTMSQDLLRAWPNSFVAFCKATGLWNRGVKRRRLALIEEVSASMQRLDCSPAAGAREVLL